MREGDRCLRCLNGAAGKSSEWHDFAFSSISITSLIHTVLILSHTGPMCVCTLSVGIPSLAMHNCKLPMELNSTGFMSLYILLAIILFCRVVVSEFPTGCLPSAKWSRTNALGHISCAWWLYMWTDWFNMCAHWECTSLGSVHMEWAVVCAGRLTVGLWFLYTCVCWLCTCRHRLHE